MRESLRAFLFVLLILSLPVQAAAPKAAAIASAHPLATKAGIATLDAGGNAFDAAVTVAAVLSVVEPYSAGLGGGGFWLLHNASDNTDIMVDAREKAPLAATADMYLDEDGNVARDWAVNGPAAAAIPGQPAALVYLARNYGRLPLSQTLAPAISLAKNGFPVDRHYRKLATVRLDALNRFPSASSIFLDHGGVPAEGFLVRQPDLAAVLSAIAEKGHDGFYAGEVASTLVEQVQVNGGIWSEEDLANYKVIERQPVVGHFRGARIVSAAPPSSGGVVLLETLGILEKLEASLEQPGNVTPLLHTHFLVESMRRAYRDRALYLGDPDFVDMPLQKLLSGEYHAGLAASVDPDKATPSTDLGLQVVVEQGDHTTHLSVLDMQGNRVAATLSINLPFGSAFVAEGTGVVLNNEMDDFSAKPGAANAYGLVGSEANAIAPGKRPLSSMTPTFVEFGDKVAIIGTPGGSRIISMVTLGILKALDGAPPKDWVSAGRFHHQYLPDRIQAEPEYVGTQIAKELMLMGHDVISTGRPYGNMQAVLLDTSTGEVEAASDPRAIGKAVVRATGMAPAGGK